jgi:hypothetical protein
MPIAKGSETQYKRLAMSDFALIRQKIIEKRDAVQKLDRERQRLLDQVAAYEELLPVEPKKANGEDGAAALKARGLSPQSREFLALLKNRDSFGFDDAVQLANKVGINIEKKGMRTRLHQYVGSGYVARISDGVFQLTKKGIESAA